MHRYEIATEVAEKITVSIGFDVHQVAPDDKPGFCRFQLSYGDLSAESAEKLKAVFADFQSRVKDVIDRDVTQSFTGSYDDLLCTEMMATGLMSTLTDMGYEYAREKGIEIPKAESLRRTPRR